ncbi:MAG: ferritin family protein [Verrucomicrobia bacterium]|nr:ferritin family protein [Verrucomicrobiota bacterium]MBU4285319.1 ferritin family protein [Verrucomicrobiota bacterium]
MAFIFNADEVFEMAEQIERNGAAFYRLAAKQFPAQQRLLTIIAEQEDQHCATFSALRRQLASKDKEATAYDPGQEAEAYLRAMADRRVVDISRRPKDILKGAESFADILGIAVGMEKDSIVFYVGMQDMVPPALGRDKVDLIIKEEKQHIVFLNRLFDEQCPPSGG